MGEPVNEIKFGQVWKGKASGSHVKIVGGDGGLVDYLRNGKVYSTSEWNFVDAYELVTNSPDWSEVEAALRVYKEANKERLRIEDEIKQANVDFAALRDRLSEQEQVVRDAGWKYQDALRKVEDSL